MRRHGMKHLLCAALESVRNLKTYNKTASQERRQAPFVNSMWTVRPRTQAQSLNLWPEECERVADPQMIGSAHVHVAWNRRSS